MASVVIREGYFCFYFQWYQHDSDEVLPFVVDNQLFKHPVESDVTSGVKRSENEAGCSSPPSAEIKDAWSSTFTPHPSAWRVICPSDISE